VILGALVEERKRKTRLLLFDQNLTFENRRSAGMECWRFRRGGWEVEIKKWMEIDP